MTDGHENYKSKSKCRFLLTSVALITILFFIIYLFPLPTEAFPELPAVLNTPAVVCDLSVYYWFGCRALIVTAGHLRGL